MVWHREDGPTDADVVMSTVRDKVHLFRGKKKGEEELVTTICNGQWKPDKRDKSQEMDSYAVKYTG